MGLDDLVEDVSTKDEKEKLKSNPMCPGCGSREIEKKEYYWRCNNDGNCDVVTFMNSSI